MRYILFNILFFCLASLSAQTFKVDYFSGDNTVYNIEIIDNNVWAGGYLGLTRINKINVEDRERIIDPFVDYKPFNCFGVYIGKGTKNNLFLNDSKDLFQFQNNYFKHIKGDLFISKMYIDEKNICWLLNRNSEIIKIENNEITRINPENSNLPNYYYQEICVENDVIWLGTYGNGIIKYANNNVTEFTSNNSGLPHDIISSIDIKNGVVWVDCRTQGYYPKYDNANTLVKYSGGIWTKYNYITSQIPSTNINKIKAFNNGIYLCSADGLIKFDGSTWSVINKAKNNLQSDNVTAFAVDGDDLWIGTDCGVSLIRDNLTTNFNIANSTFSINGAFQGPIVEDMKGTIWVGTAGTYGNLCKYNGEKWTEVIKADYNYSNSFYSIAVDHNNVIWATTYGPSSRLYRIDGDSVTKFDEYNSVIQSPLMDVVVDKYNNKWITSDWKIIKFNDSVWTVYDDSDFENLKLPRSIATDKKGNVWIGLNHSGMVKFNGTTWTPFDDTFFGNEYSEVNKIIVDKDDNLWLDYSHGTIEPKLCKYNGEKLEWFDSNINLPVKAGGLKAIDKNGNIWYGSGNGMAKYDWKKWTYYSSKNTRLLSDLVCDFYIDNENNKWISADCYLAKFNEDSLYHKSIYNPDQKQKAKFTLFPNPINNNLLNVRVNDILTTSIKAIIFDMKGQVKIGKEFSVNSDFTIDLNNLSEGFYMIQFIENGKPETHKFLKIK